MDAEAAVLVGVEQTLRGEVDEGLADGVALTPYCSAICLTVNSSPGCRRPASISSRSASAICCRSVLRVTPPLAGTAPLPSSVSRTR